MPETSSLPSPLKIGQRVRVVGYAMTGKLLELSATAAMILRDDCKMRYADARANFEAIK